MNNLERDTYPDLVKYIMSPDNRERKFIIITRLPTTLMTLIREVDPDFDPSRDIYHRSKQFLNGDIRIFVSNMSTMICGGYDFGDKIGNDQREFILFPTLERLPYSDQQSFLYKVRGRCDDKSVAIITRVFRRDDRTYFTSIYKE